MLGDPGEEGLAVVRLGFAEVAGSDWTWRANLRTGSRGTVGSPSSRKEEAETRGGGPCGRCAHLAAPAAPEQAATAGTGQGTGAGGLASKRAAGAATAAGCPAATRVTNFRGGRSVHTMDTGKSRENLVTVKVLIQLLHWSISKAVLVVKCAEDNNLLWHLWHHF